MRYLALISLGCATLFTANLAQATCAGINCNCSISATALGFGSYTPSATLDSTNVISITCSALLAGFNVGYDIQLSTGNSGNYSTRTMADGGHTLNYNIYTNGARSTIWGDGSSGTSIVSDSYLLNLISATRQYTAYGRIPAGQNPYAGTYQDTIIATVIF